MLKPLISIAITVASANSYGYQTRCCQERGTIRECSFRPYSDPMCEDTGETCTPTRRNMCEEADRSMRVGEGLCTLNGKPVAFARLTDPLNSLVVAGIIKFSGDTDLMYSFNANYGIGGSVEFENRAGVKTLLRWHSEHAETIAEGVAEANGIKIACKLNENR